MTIVEVLIAVVVLAGAGGGLIAALGQTRHTMRSVRATERQIDSASLELDRLVLLDRAALVARGGWTTRGTWWIRITRVSSALFDASVGTSSTSEPLLSTTLYRPDTIDAR